MLPLQQFIPQAGNRSKPRMWGPLNPATPRVLGSNDFNNIHSPY